MAFAQFALGSANGFVVALFYVVAGLGWVLPAMPVVSWMQRADKAVDCHSGAPRSGEPGIHSHRTCDGARSAQYRSGRGYGFRTALAAAADSE